MPVAHDSSGPAAINFTLALPAGHWLQSDVPEQVAEAMLS
jgi:hypothetical protein